MGLVNPMELSLLLKTSLKSVLIGRCFAFSFRIRPNEAPSQLSEILKSLPEQSLVASSIKTLGKTNQTVLAAIESQLQSTEASPTAQSQAPTSANQSKSCDSSSLLYESVGAGSPLAIRLESYCEPSNVCSATGISSSHTGACPSSHTGACPSSHTGACPSSHTGACPSSHTGACPSSHTGACPSSSRLTMKTKSSVHEEYSLNDLRCLLGESSVNITPNCRGDDACVSISDNDSVAGVDETLFTDSEVSEILQDLILDWESSQQPQATTRASTSVIQASSLLTDSISEQEVSSYAWSVDFLKDFMSSFSDPPPTNPTPDCTSRKSDSVFTPSLHSNTTTSCGTPELFSSTSSPKTGKTFKHTTAISPELFGSSDCTSTARQQYTQSSKFVTPAIHRTHPRRNILEPIASCSSHPQGAERMKRKIVSAAVAGSRSPLGEVTCSSPELFSP